MHKNFNYIIHVLLLRSPSNKLNDIIQWTSALRRPFLDIQWMSALKRPKRSVEAERRQEPAPRVSGSAIALKTKRTSPYDDVLFVLRAIDGARTLSSTLIKALILLHLYTIVTIFVTTFK